MSESSYNKMDFIIIIVLSLLVAFIIGFNIIQLVDSKLSSVTINVPPQNCNLPPIYLNIDKNSNIKQINLNDVISTASNESIYSPHTNTEHFISDNNDNDNNNLYEIENFGNIQDYPEQFDDNTTHIMTGLINSKQGLNTISNKSVYETTPNPNYNTVNDIPLLVSPDTDVPNKAGPNAKGYWISKVKLIEDSNSPLMKLAKENIEKINSTVAKCNLEKSKRIPEINGTFDGYNAFVDLRTDSYANITSIGKSMLTPYTSYPVPS